MSGDLGLLLSLPMDSIAVRAVLASLVAVVLGRLLLRADVVRVPRVRAAVAVVPGLALVVVLVAFASSPSLPGLWLPVDAVDGLPVRVADTYLSFAPVAASLLLAAWVAISGVLLLRRLGGVVVQARRRREALALAPETPAALVALVDRLVAAMGIAAPRVVLAERLHGGAMVLGVRNPVLVVDASLARRLDEAELEGVVAHELAHVLRRDNLVAFGLGVLRDVFFFVPGGAWSLGRLLREREHAADQAAASVTGRPGALASGLLKVIEARRADAAWSPLLPEGTLTARVEALCDERPRPTRLRVTGEALLALVTVAAAVTAAVHVPGVVAGGQGERDALGVLFSDVRPSDAEGLGEGSAAFRVYGTTTLDVPVSGVAPTPEALVDDPAAWTPSQLTACADRPASCRTAPAARTLGLRPPTVTTVADERVERWRLDPVFASDSREVQLFWFQRVQ